VKNKQWLISWIGTADHDASEKGEAVGLGPIATALQAGLQFDRVCLLTNFPHVIGKLSGLSAACKSTGSGYLQAR
jgi:hypothetical protein